MRQIIQFSFKFHDIPDNVPVLDCRAIRNPFVRGLAESILLDRVRRHPNFESVVQQGVELLKKHDTLYVGCDYGRHRSGAVAQELAARMGAKVTVLQRNSP